jgi:phage terminase large subunit GpA-like protein
MNFHAVSAEGSRELELVASALSITLRPPDPVPLSRWLGENIKLIDGDRNGEMWSAGGAPYLVEIADCLNEDDPCTIVTVRKSEQTGASILALSWCLYLADREPCNVLYAAPTGDMLQKLNSGKFQLLIDAWQAHTGRVVIAPQTSRQAKGSTTYEKVFSGGRIWLANANAVMDLSSVTAKAGVKDEVSKWRTLENGANPESLFFGRFTAFRGSENYKILEISTPEVDTGDPANEDHCRIDRSFQESDQRYWNCNCPGCGNLFVFHFDRFEVNAENPELSGYRHFCGHLITELERKVAVRGGRWIASNEDGRHPGFHIDVFISLMMGNKALAEDWLRAQKGGEIAKKDFSTQKLGLPYRFRGDAPDYEKLMARREDYARGRVPPGCLIVTIGCDVQMRGIYFEVLAWTPTRRSYVIECGYLDGDTTEHDQGAFAALTELYHRRWPDAFGNLWGTDEFGIDANYRTNTVYAWTRLHPRTKALQGRDGWARPALGTATDQDVDYRGKKWTRGAKLRGVGTWPLKSTHYSYLALTADKPGIWPDGFCHFATWQDEIYFKQITSEFLAKEKFRGREKQVWKVLRGGENHFLDCRIYNMALADEWHSKLTKDQWADVAKQRGLPAELDLFTPKQLAAPHGKPVALPAPVRRGLYGGNLDAANKGVLQ